MSKGQNNEGTTQMSEAWSILLGAMSERSTLNCMRAPMPPEPPRGRQTYKYNVGDTVQSSGVGPLKKGVRIKIVERYKQNGYCYYRDENNSVHREKDIEPLAPTAV